MDTFAELGSLGVPWHWMSIPQRHDSRLEPVTSPRQRDPLPSNQSDPNFGSGSISDAWPVQILPGDFEQDSAFGLSNSSSACYPPPPSSPGQDSTTSLHIWNNIDPEMIRDYADNSACYFPPSSSGWGSTTSLHDWNNIDFKLTQGYGSSQGQELYPDSDISSLASLPHRPGSAAHYACDICAKVFGRQTDLKRHKETSKMHETPSGIACPAPGCKYSGRFTRVDNFRIHYLRQHGKTNDEVDAFIAVWRAQGIGNGGKKEKAWGVDNLKTQYGVGYGNTEEEVDAFVGRGAWGVDGVGIHNPVNHVGTEEEVGAPTVEREG
ncbi:hypothetical protein HOY82DRAFT_534437 [Tuber indicum]|nr:hypothetical protein HOY82DRAFT_534437 [Tuber indicum]